MSLYEELGGEAAVHGAVGIFYKRVMSDNLIKEFFKDVDMEAQATSMKAFLTYAFGGPAHYSGKSMRAAHAHLVAHGLNGAHFDAVAGHLRATLEEMKAPSHLIDQVIAIAASTRNDVLNL